MTQPSPPLPGSGSASVSTRSLTDALRERRRRKGGDAFETERSIISDLDRKSAGVRIGTTIVGVLTVVGLFVAAVGPLLWLFKASTSTSTELLADPFALWPSGFHWENYTEAFRRVRFGTYLSNTGWVALGSWVVGMIVFTTGGYAMAILRPAYGKVVFAMVLATLFIPSVIALVPLYLTIVNVPLLNISLMDTFWAVWLPAGASAFNVLLVHRAFSSLPRDLFDAAKIDGAGAFRVFWSIVLPMSRPILGVVSLLTIVAAYKDYLWPLLVLRRWDVQTLSVALPRLEASTEISVYMAALFISLAIPVAFFLLFAKQFLSAAGAQGSIKE